ncbi:MAG: arylesterase [Burkholderiales bacterium]|nr:arylesterase [Burkholderiales bacterium]
MIFRFLFVLMLMLPAAPGLAATIMVYGDSLSAGYGLPQEQGWVSLLQKKLHAENKDYKVINLSISGETTLGGKNRIASALEAHRPAIVIIALGANDGLRGQNLEAMRANLEAIIQTCRRFKARVLLIGMRLPPNYGPIYGEKFHQVFVDLARRRNLALAPFLLEGFGEDRALFQADGIHPAAPAQPLMMDTVWKTLRPLLR